MEKVKSFKEFINETFLDNQTDAGLLDYDKKKMEKNGYFEAEVIEPVEGLEKGDKVMVSGTEFGQLDDDAFVICYRDDEEIIIAKNKLQVCV